jgi:uncharacterized membrane protein
MAAWRGRSRIFLAVLYGLAGTLHIVMPLPFLSITPEWVPYPTRVIFLTGLCELAGAVGLAVPKLSRHAAIALALHAVCVFPANLKHAYDTLTAAGASPLEWFYHVFRLPLQAFIVWLALFAGRVVSWPYRK